MEHLTQEQKQICKSNLEKGLQTHQSELSVIMTAIQNHKSKNEEVPSSVSKQKEKIESKISSIQKSLQHFENGTYGLDIHTGAPIPFAKLSGFPDLKVCNGSTAPQVTTLSGAGRHSYGENRYV